MDNFYGKNLNTHAFANNPQGRTIAKTIVEGPNKTSIQQQPVFVNNTSSIEIATGNRWRTYLFIQNRSANDVYIAFGATATEKNGVLISSGGFIELDTRPPNNKITAIGTVAADQQIIVLEGSIEQSERDKYV